MKIKFFFRIILVAITSTMLTGCATSSLLEKYRWKTVEAVNPSAIYKSTDSENFAIEGFLHTYPYDKLYIRNLEKGSPTHLIIPSDFFTNQGLPKNHLTSLDEITKWAEVETKKLKPANTLPANFQKVTDLPKNDVWIQIKEYRTESGIIIFIPFTIAFDVVTSPIQIPIYILIGMSMGHGC